MSASRSVHGWRRSQARSIALAAAVVGALTLAAPAPAPAASMQAAEPVAHSSAGPPPRLTSWLKNVARQTARIKVRQRNPQWRQSRVKRIASRIVRRWIRKKARECVEGILTEEHFCSRPPRPRWGLGVALSINGEWPATFRSPWSVQNPVHVLRPGVTFWLTCWTAGSEIRNAIARSNLWYRLTNRHYVSDGWLDTGTNRAIPGVPPC